MGLISPNTHLIDLCSTILNVFWRLRSFRDMFPVLKVQDIRIPRKRRDYPAPGSDELVAMTKQTKKVPIIAMYCHLRPLDVIAIAT